MGKEYIICNEIRTLFIDILSAFCEKNFQCIYHVREVYLYYSPSHDTTRLIVKVFAKINPNNENQAYLCASHTKNYWFCDRMEEDKDYMYLHYFVPQEYTSVCEDMYKLLLDESNPTAPVFVGKCKY